MGEIRDPWADVREWIEVYGFGGTAVHNLLNDADALLAVRGLAQTVIDEELHGWESQGYQSLRELDIALVNLAKHLR